ncbi:hypothetical protein DFH11DRAFT_1749628 [Phellopilus nigrolimitatus]|nr:hypothetical protein DFH11DRAFT_1749628 [Phellopilus nigrolimitatus]
MTVFLNFPPSPFFFFALYYPACKNTYVSVYARLALRDHVISVFEHEETRARTTTSSSITGGTPPDSTSTPTTPASLSASATSGLVLNLLLGVLFYGLSNLLLASPSRAQHIRPGPSTASTSARTSDQASPASSSASDSNSSTSTSTPELRATPPYSDALAVTLASAPPSVVGSDRSASGAPQGEGEPGDGRDDSGDGSGTGSGDGNKRARQRQPARQIQRPRARLLRAAEGPLHPSLSRMKRDLRLRHRPHLVVIKLEFVQKSTFVRIRATPQDTYTFALREATNDSYLQNEQRRSSDEACAVSSTLETQAIMTSAVPRAQTLPFEITENIIQLYLGGPYTFPDSHRPSDLAPLLLVCKGWHEYGERQLYRSIYFTTYSKDSEDSEDSEASEDSEDNEDNKAIGVMLLRWTLWENSRLANLVRFFTFESKCFDSDTVFAIAEIITLTPNLTHVSISRLSSHWQNLHPSAPPTLRHALSKRSLQYFRLFSTFRCMSEPPDEPPDALCSPEETAELIADWPDLEEFSLVEWGASSDPFELPPETPARCLALRRIKVQGLDTACFIAKMAPFVEDVDIAHNTVSGTLACLHTWSETLTRLSLYIVEGNSNVIRHFPPLRKLRYFRCEATDMHPRLLATMDSLEELFYCVRPQRAEQLVNCFREGTGSGDFLPALKVLHFRSAVLVLDPERRFSQDEYDEWVEPSRAALKSLGEICARRSISFSVDDELLMN